jgi:hypothetical protein
MSLPHGDLAALDANVVVALDRERRSCCMGEQKAEKEIIGTGKFRPPGEKFQDQLRSTRYPKADYSTRLTPSNVSRMYHNDVQCHPIVPPLLLYIMPKQIAAHTNQAVPLVRQIE